MEENLKKIPVISLGPEFMEEVMNEVYPEGHEIARQMNIEFYSGALQK